jgi:hypothetical protein
VDPFAFLQLIGVANVDVEVLPWGLPFGVDVAAAFVVIELDDVDVAVAVADDVAGKMVVVPPDVVPPVAGVPHVAVVPHVVVAVVVVVVAASAAFVPVVVVVAAVEYEAEFDFVALDLTFETWP